MNRHYLEQLRGRSCYPTFRGFVQVSTLLGYLFAVVIAVVAIATQPAGPMLIGIALAIIVALLTRVAKEMSLMLADIADATIDKANPQSGSTQAQQVRNPPPSDLSNVDPSGSDEELMNYYDISLVDGTYRCGSYQFASLDKALSHARHLRGLRGGA